MKSYAPLCRIKIKTMTKRHIDKIINTGQYSLYLF